MAQQTDHIGDTNKMVTAVEWFAFQIMDSWNDIQNGKTSIDELIEQAKQMEKRQLIKAYEDGWQYGWHGIEHIDSDEYYKKTYED